MPDPLANAGLEPPKSTTTPDTSGWPSAAPSTDDNRRVGDPENPLQDLWGNVQGLVGGIGDVAKGYYNIMTDDNARSEWKKGWSQYLENKGNIRSEVHGHIWNGLKQETSNHWTNEKGDFDLGYTLWHHPASAMMDLALVKDVATGGAKMFGKMAGGTSRALMSAGEISKLAPMTTADKIVNYAERAGKVNLDPFALTGKAVLGAGEKLGLVGPIKEALGFGPETHALDAVAAHNEAEVGLEQMRKDALLTAKKYGPDGADRIRGALWRGSNEDFMALKPEEQDFVRNYFESRKVPYDIQEERIKRGFISEAERDGALAKQASLFEYGDVSKPHVQDMMERMKLGAGDPRRVNPSYIYLASEKDHEYSLLENLMRDATGAPGKVSFLEGRTGQGDYVKDPLRAALAQNRMEAQFDKKIRLFDRTLDYLQSKGLVKLVERDQDIPRGFDIIPNEIWKKYLLSEKRAGGLAFAEATKGFDATTASRQAAEKFLTDPALYDHIANNKVVAVPKYVSNWMRYRLGIPGPIARTYDRTMRYWKDMATMLRPGYWINVAGGNGFLSALHGVSPMDAARYWRNRKLLPPELQSIVQTRMGPKGATCYQQVMTNLQQLDSMVHTNFTKGPGFAHEVEAIRRQAVETAAALKDAGQKFFIGADTLADPDKFYQLVASSPEDLSKAIQEHVLMREQLASQAPEVQRLQAQYNKAASELQKFQKQVAGGQPNQQQFLQLTALEDNERAMHKELFGKKEEYLDAAQKEGMMRSSLPNQQRLADWAEKAIEPVNELEGAYLRLHPFERNYLRRIIPFYPWTKAMTKLVFQLPFAYPKQTFMWNRYSAMMQDLMSSDEHTPEWLRGAVPVGLTGDGAMAFVKPFWSPFSGERPGTLGGTDMPSIVSDVFKQNPLFKVIMDLHGGVNQFTMKPFSTDENMVRMDNGEVWKLKSGGKWEKTIAQPSIWKELYSLFPHSQMIDQLFLAHVQTDKGFGLHPDPIKDAAGNPMYPIPFMQRATKLLGLPVVYRDPQQDLMQQKKESDLYKKYIKEIKHMPPDEQQTAIKVLEDAFRVKK